MYDMKLTVMAGVAASILLTNLRTKPTSRVAEQGDAENLSP